MGGALRVVVGTGVLSVVLLLVGSFTFLPALVDRTVSAALQRQHGLSEAPSVRLQSDPPTNVLRGVFTGGRIVITGGEFGGVQTERVTVELDPFRLDVLESVTSGRMVIQGAVSGEMQAELTEEEVSQIAREEVEEFEVTEVGLNPGRVTIGSDVEILGLGVPITVGGGLELIEGEQELEFLPREVEAFGVGVPQEITDQLLEDADFRFTLEELPFEMDLREVEVQDGRVVASGVVNDFEGR